jgi:ubiquinone/menaquinone biosynthesis C-methylase UbiE
MLMNWPERVWIYSPVRVLFLKRHAETWKRLVVSRQADRCLEIGCGLGRGARILIEQMGFRKVFAFDLEEHLIKSATRRLPARLEDRIRFSVGDAQDLPFGDSQFDAVVNYGIIHHVLDWRRCIREIGRVLRTGGVFYFEEIYPPLYANFLMKRVVRHPTRDRFEGRRFSTSINNLQLVHGVRPVRN